MQHWQRQAQQLGMHESWFPALKPVAAEFSEVLATLDALPTAEHAPAYLPHRSQLLRACAQPFEQVKVLIVGQDPYPTPGHAMGLAFSVAPGVAAPRSLQNIYRELADDCGIEPVSHGDLRAWTEQGVCLLNRVFSVAPGQAASHQGLGWEPISAALITALAQRDQPLVAILWGKPAQQAQAFLGDTPCICSPHPSPLSARRGFFGSRPFSGANALLQQQGATPVDWQLPAPVESPLPQPQQSL